MAASLFYRTIPTVGILTLDRTKERARCVSIQSASHVIMVTLCDSGHVKHLPATYEGI